MKIIVMGLGLIGGSIAKALKQNTDHTVLGMNRSEGPLLDAISCGAVERKADRADLADADMVYICTYPDSVLEFMEKYGPLMKEGCVVTDACGVKQELCAAMEKIKKNGKYAFVASHPMAGKELSGFAASDPGIFVGASYLIVPGDAPKWAVDRVADLAMAMRFGRIVLTEPEQHDKEIAFTSQTPHVLACAYVMSPRCEGHDGFSAGSYRDVSRVANINHSLWTGLFLDNRKALVEELDELQRNISLFRDAIDREDEAALDALLLHAGERKRQLG